MVFMIKKVNILHFMLNVNNNRGANLNEAEIVFECCSCCSRHSSVLFKSVRDTGTEHGQKLLSFFLVGLDKKCQLN